MAKVINNSHNPHEMEEMGERWASHEGKYMTLSETLAHAAGAGKAEATQESKPEVKKIDGMKLTTQKFEPGMLTVIDPGDPAAGRPPTVSTFGVKRARINVSNSTELAYWCKRFGCSPNVLMDAIRAVGPNPEDVGVYLGVRV